MVINEIKNRFSVRSYLPKEINDSDLNDILEAGRLAPSACNIQPWKFVVVKDQALKDKLSIACKNQMFLSQASVLIVGCLELAAAYKMSERYDSGALDMGIAMTNMTLQAVNLGLGSCWIGAFYEDQIKEILNIPTDIRVVALLTIGYPANKNIPAKSRKEISEIVRIDEYS
jgi:nitroreductase